MAVVLLTIGWPRTSKMTAAAAASRDASQMQVVAAAAEVVTRDWVAVVQD